LVLLSAFSLQAASPGATLLFATNANDSDIQTALDRLPEGGEVILGPGTYEIHRPIILRRNGQTLRGNGLTTILHLADHANCPVIILGAPVDATPRTVSHVKVADLLIDGNRLNEPVELWKIAIDGSWLNNNGIDVWNVTDSEVEAVVCRSCRSGGLVTTRTRNLTVNDFTAYDNQFDGLACYETENSKFSGLNLHDNLAAGISLDLSFNHNVISNAELAGNDSGVFMRNSRNNSFHDLTINRSRNDGVFMAQTAEPGPKGWVLAAGTECTGNDFEGLTITNCGGNAFVIHDASCTDNLVHHALFMNNTPGGFSPVL
jgi:hypothetical protein